MCTQQEGKKMGGNVTIERNGKTYKAQKINLVNVGVNNFRAIIRNNLVEINKLFRAKFGHFIWSPDLIESGEIFNGSTSYIMSKSYEPDEITKYKTFAGDVDVTVPEEFKEHLYDTLKGLEGLYVTSRDRYLGNNKCKRKSIGNQLNCIFELDFGDTKHLCQVDFEFVPYEDGKPTQWAMFSHNSDFRDTKLGIKAVHHKYLIRALVGSMSYRPDVAIATASSQIGNVKLSTSVRDREARMLKFSVGRGIREAYEPILDENGHILYIDGKYIYKMTNSKTADYTTDIKEMVKLIFALDVADEIDADNFRYFDGVIDLLQKYASEEQINHLHDRYIHLLWKPTDGRGQELESGDPELDMYVKISGYQHFVKKLRLTDRSSEYLELYYSSYGQRK